MSPTLHELIGRIIDPGLPSTRPAAAPRAAAPAEPLPVLIGRILGPPAAAPRSAAAELRAAA